MVKNFNKLSLDVKMKAVNGQLHKWFEKLVNAPDPRHLDKAAEELKIQVDAWNELRKTYFENREVWNIWEE